MKFFFKFGEDFRLFRVFMYVIINSAIVKKIKVSGFVIN